MNRWILRRPSWVRFAGCLPFFLIAAAVCLLCTYIAYVFTAKFAFDAGFDWIHFAIGILIFLFAVIFAFICFGIVQDCFSQVVVTSQGIEQRQFGKSQCFLPWDELAETGIALEKWTVRGGPDRCLYFADRHLDEFERAVIDVSLDKPKGGRIIKVACKGIQNEDALKRICPISIPVTQKPQNIKLNLPAYRRARNSDESWGCVEVANLPDAGEVVYRFRMLQQEHNKQHRH